MWIEFLKLVIGLGLLVYGADVFVRAASKIAHLLGVSSLVIGLTVVAFGTSAPELFVSLKAAFAGSADIAIGNVLGSNVFNILVIIGLSAIFSPVQIDRVLVRRDLPIMIGAMFAFVFVCFGGVVSRLEGAGLFVGIITYIVFTYIVVLKERKSIEELPLEAEVGADTDSSLIRNFVLLVIGLVMLAFGSDLIVEAARVIAKSVGVSDAVIGITLVAIGTSLPELATTVSAALRGEADLAIGNAIGSNIFNVLCVIGITSLFKPLNVSDAIMAFDIWYMLSVCVIAFLVMKFRSNLKKLEGGFLILLYLGYMAYTLFQSA